jgi:hypothetical protein
MLQGINANELVKLKQDRDSKLGKYLSRAVSSVSRTGDFYVVVYDAQFEKNSPVAVRVVFRTTAPNQVSGLWFNK